MTWKVRSDSKRRVFKQIIRSLAKHEEGFFSTKSLVVQKQVWVFLVNQADKRKKQLCVGLYTPRWSEVRINILSNKLHVDSRFKCGMVKVDATNNELVYWETNLANDSCEASCITPKNDITNELDVVLVPIVGFNKQHNRLGYGGGYFDRFLSNRPKLLSLGVAFNEQLITELIFESHDVKLSNIIYN